MTTTHSPASFPAYTAQLREFISQHSSQPAQNSDAEFNRLALSLFELQMSQNAAYRHFAHMRKASVASVKHWTEIPALPTAGFKELELTCIEPDHRTTCFHSSGTTGKKHSRHFHCAESLAIYEASLLPWFQQHFLPAALEQKNLGAGLIGGDGKTWVFLTPTVAHARHSSLIHMFEKIRHRFGSGNSFFTGQAETDGSWELDLNATVGALRNAIAAKRPVILCGTAFTFVHLLDHLDQANLLLRLPPGSRALETGGYKGRSRTVPKAELHALITDLLGIPSSHIVCEYGMSELSSQAYDGVVGNARADRRIFQFPPWARVQVVSPENGREVGEGQTGLVRIFDLANVYSVMAVQTEDLGIRRDGGFELVGRATTAEQRGCSLMSI